MGLKRQKHKARNTEFKDMAVVFIGRANRIMGEGNLGTLVHVCTQEERGHSKR